jgi:hypothetical protein
VRMDTLVFFLILVGGTSLSLLSVMLAVHVTQSPLSAGVVLFCS